MFNFQEWAGQDQVELILDVLLETVRNLDSSDPVANLPTNVITPQKAKFYLPDFFVKQITESAYFATVEDSESQNPSMDDLKDFREQNLFPFIRINTALLAIANEIVLNHIPNNSYKVRITDG